MADTTKVAAKAAKAPTGADIERAHEFAREPFLLEGEKPKDLAAGTPRRLALDAALAEIDAGHETPSIEWRRSYSLMLGLERLLSEETPHLADDAELSDHQVDALSGTLAALIAELEDSNGKQNGAAGNGATKGSGNGAAASGANGAEPLDGASEDDDALEPDEEPKDWDEAEEDEDVTDEAPEDPGASRRFWFEHATGAGKTVAAVGFIEASRTGGVLILTHR